MNHALNRKADRLEKDTEKELYRQVYEIYMRYGFDRDKLWAHASEVEKQILIKYYKPKAIERFSELWPIFAPIIHKTLFEFVFYPLFYRLQLSGSITRDQALNDLEHHLDMAYDCCCAPDVMELFYEELIPPDPDEDPEGFANHRISSELAAHLQDVKRERDALKDQCFEKMLQTLKEEEAYEKETLRLEEQWSKKEESKGRAS